MRKLILTLLFLPALAHADCGVIEFAEADTYDLPALCSMSDSAEKQIGYEIKSHIESEGKRMNAHIRSGYSVRSLKDAPWPTTDVCKSNKALARRLIDKKFPFDPESPPCGWYSKSKSDEIRKKWAEEEEARRNKP